MSLTDNLTQLSFYSGENYQKKYTYASYTTALNAGNTWESTQVVTHDLGYIPNVRVWIEQDGDGRVRSPNPINSTKETVVVTKSYSNRVEITCSSPTSSNNVSLNVYYEIYLDADDTGETGVNFFSKYPVDRVYEVLEGSFSVNGEDVATQSVAHTQGKPMVFKAIWSYDNVNWYSVRDFYDPSNVDDNFTGEFDVSSSVVRAYAFNGFAASKTFYYKIALMEPEVDYPAGFTTSGINFDTRKDTFKNFESSPRSTTLSGTIASNAIKTFEVTLTNSMGLNVADFYFKTSSDTFFYNGYVGAGTGLVSVPVTGGAFTTDLPIEFFLTTTNGVTKAVMWLFNTDPNTVTITSTTIDLRFILYVSPFS
jgi:hypothetical protein